MQNFSLKRLLKTALKVSLSIVFGSLVLIGLLLGALWLDHTRPTTLPVPTGPFAVGRTTGFWIDPAHDDPMAPQPGTKRQLAAWIWYPAVQSSADTADYMPSPWRAARTQAMSPVFSQLINRDYSRVHTHSYAEAPMSIQQAAYPVVLMRAGLAAQTTDYTSLAEDLASHGYVVAGFDAPWRSSEVVFPDGKVALRLAHNNADLLGGPAQEQLALRLMKAWSGDMSFALDQLVRLNRESGRFQGRLDLERVGAFGHSLGGATALDFCRRDARCKAGIDIDGAPLGEVVQSGVQQPFLFLLSDHSKESAAEAGPVMANIHSIYLKLPHDRRLEATIRNAGHFGFSDGAVLRVPMVMQVLHATGILSVDGRRQIAITTDFDSRFFDVWLKGAPNSRNLWDFPEVELTH